MPGVARVTDRTIGVCVAHTIPITIGGTIIVGSPDVNANNLSVSRIGDTVLADCGHTSVIITGSPDVYANGISVGRLNDQVGGGPYSAIIITASPDVFANG
jgi:uncharacterized Zn-binding protein involved in type VI secretion